MSNQSYPPEPQGQGYRQPPNQNPYERQTYNAGGVYEQRQQQSYVDPAGNRVENSEAVYENRNQSRANARYWITAVTYFLLSVLEIILLLRFIFRLLGANQYNDFIRLLYGVSSVFVIAFNGIFNDQTLGRVGVFEVSTIIAMIVYALIAWGIVSLGRILFAPTLSNSQSVTTTRRSRY